MTTESVLIIDYTDENGEKRMQRVRFPIDSTYEDFTGRVATRIGHPLDQLYLTFTDPVEKCDFDLSPDEDLATIIRECYKIQVKVKNGTPRKLQEDVELAETISDAVSNVNVAMKYWQGSVKTDWMCKKNGAQHAFFLSYRVDSEKSFSQTLAHALDAGVRSNIAIHAFLDVHCLTSGKEWIESFITGLWNSVVFVPEDENRHETPDNMLLEWEIALDIRDKKLRDISYLTVAVPDPVMGTRDRRVLATFSSFGIPRCLPQSSPRTRKIKDTISEILKYQGVRADPDIVDPTAGDLLRMWNALKPGAAAPTVKIAAEEPEWAASTEEEVDKPKKGYILGWHHPDTAATHRSMKHFHEANIACARILLDAKTEMIYLAYFLPYYDSVREEVEDRVFAVVKYEREKPAFAVVWQEPNTAKVRYEKFQRFGDAATFYYRLDKDAARVLADRDGDVWMCHLEAGEIGRIDVLRHLEGLVQLSSPTVQPKYIFSYHYGTAQSTTFSDFAKAHSKFDDVGFRFARVISDTAGRIYLSYFFPTHDSVRNEVMECHYEKIYSSKDYAVVYHHPDKGVQTERFSDYNKALERYDTLKLAKLLRDGNGHIYDSYFVPDYTHIRDEVMVFSNGLQL
ncbi:hypothetical protein BC829DRAFT_385299 [Chytridium lagenaria]|nr:hypothetical protein BC829DRAFT_385299 [Chytridium lagenaria]